MPMQPGLTLSRLAQERRIRKSVAELAGKPNSQWRELCEGEPVVLVVALSRSLLADHGHPWNGRVLVGVNLRARLGFYGDVGIRWRDLNTSSTISNADVDVEGLAPLLSISLSIGRYTICSFSPLASGQTSTTYGARSTRAERCSNLES